jgi:hypothetical protein
LSTLFGGKTKTEKAQEQQFNTQFQPLITQQTGASKSALDFALPTLKQGTDTLQGPLSYFKTLAGGDRTAISQLLGPQLDSIAARDAQQRQNFSQFANRGSMMGNRLGELSQATNSDINNSFLTARSGANDQLTNIAQLLYGTGISGLNASTGASGNALQALLGYRSGNLQGQQLRQNMLGQTLSGIGSLVGTGIAPGGFLNKPLNGLFGG